MLKILLYVDVNQLDYNLNFLNRAIAYASALNGKFLLMTVLPDYDSYFLSPLLPDQFKEKADAKVREALEEFVARYLPEVLMENIILRYGLVHTQILAVAEEEKVDLIFLNCDRAEPVDYLLCTIEGRVNRRAPCDIMFFHRRS